MKEEYELFSKETYRDFFLHKKHPRKLKKAMNKCYFLTNTGKWYIEHNIRRTKLMQKAVEYLNYCERFTFLKHLTHG